MNNSQITVDLTTEFLKNEQFPNYGRIKKYELLLASYGLRTVSNMLRVLLRTLPSFSRNNCVGMARMVRPHLDN